MAKLCHHAVAGFSRHDQFMFLNSSLVIYSSHRPHMQHPSFIFMTIWTFEYLTGGSPGLFCIRISPMPYVCKEYDVLPDEGMRYGNQCANINLEARLPWFQPESLALFLLNS